MDWGLLIFGICLAIQTTTCGAAGRSSGHDYSAMGQQTLDCESPAYKHAEQVLGLAYTMTEDIRNLGVEFPGFMNSYMHQLHTDRVMIVQGNMGMLLFIINERERGELSLMEAEYKQLFRILFTSLENEPLSWQSYGIWKKLPLRRILMLLGATLHVVVDPFANTREMGIFRSNMKVLLRKAGDSISPDPDNGDKRDISKLPKSVIRTLLRICAGETYDRQDPSQLVPCGALDEKRLTLYENIFEENGRWMIFFQLLYLCDVSELNMRRCMVERQISQPLQATIWLYPFVTLIPPLDMISCKNLFLTKDCHCSYDSHGHARETIWPKLREIRLLSENDSLEGDQLARLIELEETEFVRGLVRPKLRPEDLSAVTRLDVPTGPKYLPWLEHATALQLLCFVSDGTKIGPLPDCVANMRKLRVLKLAKTGLSEISGGILENLTELQELDISGNSLEELPDELGRLEELKLLFVADNALTSLFKFAYNRSALTCLNLSGNFLATLPTEIELLTKLSVLNISNNGNPGLLSAACKCIHLHSLLAGGNQISQLPAGIHTLSKLRILDLRNNKLAEFPGQLDIQLSGRPLGLASLTKLILSKNNLTRVSASIENLKQLELLELSGNSLQRIPTIIGEMKAAKPELIVKLDGNPLVHDDTEGELGARSLWGLFGDKLMKEDEYIDRILKMEAGQFYDNLRFKSGHSGSDYGKVRWNMEAIRQMIMPAPPSRQTGGSGEVLGLWNRIVHTRLWGEIAEQYPQTSHIEYMTELIHVIFHPTCNVLRGCTMSGTNKEAMNDYLHAVLLDIVRKLEGVTSATTEEATKVDAGAAIAVVTDEEMDIRAMALGEDEGGVDTRSGRAAEMMILLSESLEFCPSRQLAELMSIYSLYCGKDDREDASQDVFVRYVRNSIARAKENAFTEAVATQEHAQNVHLLLFWKKQLKDELGLRLEYSDPYTRQEEDEFGNDPIRVLAAFSAVFTPESVIALLTQEINEEGKVGEAGKYLHEAELLSIELSGKYFELAEGVEEAAENYCFANIKEAGVREILLSMRILVQTH